MSRLVLLLALAVLAAAAAPSSRASAQRRADPIDEGIALRERGRDAEALALFERAYAETPSARALAQIALAEQALGRLVEAEAHLAEALGETGDPFIRRNRTILEGELAEIRTQVGDLTVTGGPEGAEVVVGGQALGVLPLDAPVRVVAGSVALVVRAPGHEPFETTVTVPGGGAASVLARLTRVARAEPEREIVAPPPTTSAEDGGPAWALPVGLALAGVGVVGLGVGAGLMVVREDNAQLRQRCSDVDPGCRAAYQNALDAEAGGIASFVIGGALAAGGAAVLVLSATGALGSERSDEASLACTPGLLAVHCTGRF